MIKKLGIGFVCVAGVAPNGADVFATSVTRSAVPDDVSFVPEKKWLTGGVAPGYRLTHPILLMLELDDDREYIVTDSFSTVYGNGRTSKEAVRDYCDSLTTYYDMLENLQNENVSAAVVFDKLKNYLIKLDPAKK